MAENLAVNEEEVATEQPPSMEEGNKPRLVIKEIELENFKSYGGRKVIGPFHKSFSCVVGPNGSGKSNTIDALLFVFGKRAKKIRLNKVAELIHSSVNCKNVESARVCVTFEHIVDDDHDPQGFAVVPDSEIVVAREAFRNNTSKYFLNGRPSNFTQVTKTLRASGIDLEHNRFLILQGEVEQISLMKPKAQGPHEDGFLEYLEDIIGSNQFVDSIEIQSKIVSELAERRMERLNRVQHAEREKDSLEGPKREAEEYVKTQKKLLEEQALRAQIFKCEAAKEQAALQGEVDKRQALLDQHLDAQSSKMTQVQAFEEQETVLAREHRKLKQVADELSKEFKLCESQDVKYTEDINYTNAQLQKIDKDKADTINKRKELQAKSKELLASVPGIELQLQEALQRQEKQQAVLLEHEAAVAVQTTALRKEKEDIEVELQPLQEKLNKLNEPLVIAQTEASCIREQSSKAEAHVEELRAMAREAKEKAAIRATEMQQCKQFEAENEAKLSQAQKRLAEISKMFENKKSEVASLRAKAEEGRLERNNSQGRSGLIRAVEKEAKKGSITGFHGRLGDLGTIEGKYDVAISTACSALDHLVVQTTEDAEKVVALLRRERLGRATCIVLDKMGMWEDRSRNPKQAPENVPRLFDLVNIRRPEYKGAFYFALRDTLVAKDIDQATRVGMGAQRWRVVTLDGNLVDTSGTMSGGGSTVHKGGMKARSCSVSEADVQKMCVMYEEAAQQLTALKAERAQLEVDVQEMLKFKGDVALEYGKCDMEVHACNKQLKELEQRLAKAGTPGVTPQQKAQLAQLDKQIAQHQSKSSELQAVVNAKEGRIAELQEQIANAGGWDYKVHKERLAEFQAAAENLQRSIQAAKLDAEAAFKNATGMEKTLRDLDAKRAESEKWVRELKAAHEKLDEKAEGVLNAFNDANKARDSKEREVLEVRKQKDEALAVVSHIKKQEVDLVAAVESKARQLREASVKVEHWEKKVSEVRGAFKKLPLDIIEEETAASSEEPQLPEERDEEQEAEHGQPPRKQPRLAKLDAITEDLDSDQVHGLDRQQLEARIVALEANLHKMKPNLSVIEEYRKRLHSFKEKVKEFEAVSAERDEAKKSLDELRTKRLNQFMEGFTTISMKLKEMYQMITLGGDAELELADPLDPFAEGIIFSVRPPRKSWKQIANLSGGEKTLSSLSLVFALHHYRPTPLYFMDEIDAALDFRNVSIIANYIKQRTKNAQFMVISLRNHMFELADRLVGIYKTEDVSKTVSIDPDECCSQATRKSESRRSVAVAADGASSDGPSVVAPSSKKVRSMEQQENMQPVA
mmetsp:Transcript_5244/g.12460  ORF Transcript_5244/g.12460 Transcript_5244/m.12460 type:complete len:1318 (+) Transcript_5244:93-4046(+)